MDKVYGVYSGCIYEGGGIDSTLFKDKKKARLAALKLVKKENEWRIESNEEGNFNFKLFKEVEENVWKTGHDIISLDEFKIVL